MYTTQNGQNHQHHSWVDAYDAWMARYLKWVEEKAQNWLKGALERDLLRLVQTDTRFTPAQRDAEIKWIKFHRNHEMGMFHTSQIRFAQGYEHLLRRPFPPQ